MKDLIFLIGAVLWLCHRATRLLKVPAPVLIHILGIDIPGMPQVSIDNLTDTTVSLHWSKPAGSGSVVVKYIVEVDGQKVGETDRADSSVTLKNLTPDRNYVLNVSAVNASNYKSHASRAFVHTKVSRDEGLPSTVSPIVGITSDSGMKRSRGASKLSKNSTKSERSDRDKHPTDKFYTVEALTQEVEGIQLEISDLLVQASDSEREFQASEKVLMDELEELKDRKRQDDQQRSATKMETKALDDSKRGLQTQKAKLEKRYHQLETDLERRKTTQENWHQEIAEAKFKIGELEHNIDHINDEIVGDMENARSMIETCQAELNQVEEDLKRHSQGVKRTEQNKKAAFEALKLFKEMSDPVTLLLPSDEAVVNSILSTEGLDEYFKEWLVREQEIDRRLEEEWQKTQKNLEVRYLKAHQQYEEATKAYKNAQMHQPTLHNPNGSTTSVPSIMLGGPSTSSMDVYSKSRTFSSGSNGSGTSGLVASGNGMQLFGDSNVGAAKGSALSKLSSSVFDSNTEETLPPNLLLPTDLFGGDDLTESIQNFFNQQSEFRPETSASRLQNQSLVSPKQSLLSFRASGDRDSTNVSAFDTSPPSPPNQLFPQSSFNTTFSSNMVLDADSEDNGHQASHVKEKNFNKKLSSMFFFGKNNAQHNKDKSQDLDGNSLIPSISVTQSESIFPNRPRAGSYSSALSSTTPSINPNDAFFTTWRDNGLVGDIWSDKDWNGSGPTAFTDEDRLKKRKDDKDVKSTKSSERKSSESQYFVSPSKKGRKGFVGLFDRNPASPTSPEKDKKSIASLFGKTDSMNLPEGPPSVAISSYDMDGHDPIHLHDTGNSGPDSISSLGSSADQAIAANFIQKSMRSFGSRKSISSGNSGGHKFVKRLTLFGKKDKDDEDDDELLEEDSDVVHE